MVHGLRVLRVRAFNWSTSVGNWCLGGRAVGAWVVAAWANASRVSLMVLERPLRW